LVSRYLKSLVILIYWQGQGGFEVDYWNDRFINRYDHKWSTHTPDSVGVEQYMLWLEYCKRHPNNSLASDEAAEEWYQRRLKWCTRLCKLLEDLHLGEPFKQMEKVEEVEESY
jgi:hypothetical protein